MDNFEQIWARIVRVTSFLGGMMIMTYETGWDHSDRPWLYAAAIGMMGLPIARAAENVLGHLGPKGPQESPVEHPDAYTAPLGPDTSSTRPQPPTHK